jgi:hypothetical protein
VVEVKRHVLCKECKVYSGEVGCVGSGCVRVDMGRRGVVRCVGIRRGGRGGGGGQGKE